MLRYYDRQLTGIIRPSTVSGKLCHIPAVNLSDPAVITSAIQCAIGRDEQEDHQLPIWDSRSFRNSGEKMARSEPSTSPSLLKSAGHVVGTPQSVRPKSADKHRHIRSIHIAIIRQNRLRIQVQEPRSRDQRSRREKIAVIIKSEFPSCHDLRKVWWRIARHKVGYAAMILAKLGFPYQEAVKCIRAIGVM